MANSPSRPAAALLKPGPWPSSYALGNPFLKIAGRHCVVIPTAESAVGICFSFFAGNLVLLLLVQLDQDFFVLRRRH